MHIAALVKPQRSLKMGYAMLLLGALALATIGGHAAFASDSVDATWSSPNYQFVAGQDTTHKVLKTLEELAGNWPALAAACDKTPFCVAFTHTGQLKRSTTAIKASDYIGTVDQGADVGVWVQNPRKNWVGGNKKPLTPEAVQRIADNHASHASLLDAMDLVRKETQRLTAMGLTGEKHAEALDAALSPKSLRRLALENGVAVPHEGHILLARELADSDTPATWDSRTSGPVNLVATVRSQGTCGTCFAFAASSVAEGAYAAAMNTNATLISRFSPEFLYFCNNVTNSTAKNCDAGMLAHNVSMIIQTEGMRFDRCYPYVAADGNEDKSICAAPLCPAKQTGPLGTWVSQVFLMGETGELFTLDMILAKAHIRKHGALAAQLNTNTDLDNYNGTIVQQMGPQDDNTGHAVAIVGYNDVDRYWIIKNSWGADWGPLGGYALVAYGFNTTLMTNETGGWGWIYTPAANETVSLGPEVTPYGTQFNDTLENQVGCTGMFYMGQNMTGETLMVITSAVTPASPQRAWIQDDLSFNASKTGGIQDWDRKIRSYSLKCTCVGLNGTTCFSLAKNISLVYYTDIFTSYGPMTLNGSVGILEANCNETAVCTAKGCSLPTCNTAGNVDPNFDLKIRSLALTWSWPDYSPLNGTGVPNATAPVVPPPVVPTTRRALRQQGRSGEVWSGLAQALRRLME